MYHFMVFEKLKIVNIKIFEYISKLINTCLRLSFLYLCTGCVKPGAADRTETKKGHYKISRIKVMLLDFHRPFINCEPIDSKLTIY